MLYTMIKFFPNEQGKIHGGNKVKKVIADGILIKEKRIILCSSNIP